VVTKFFCADLQNQSYRTGDRGEAGPISPGLLQIPDTQTRGTKHMGGDARDLVLLKIIETWLYLVETSL
jgi:hypothetical protein